MRSSARSSSGRAGVSHPMMLASTPHVTTLSYQWLSRPRQQLEHVDRAALALSLRAVLAGQCSAKSW